MGARLAEDLSKIDAEVLPFPEVKDERNKEARQNAIKQKKQALERDPNIQSVSYDYLRETSFVPNDPYFTGGYQWDLRRIGATGAWDKAYGGARVAVLDTGIDTGHPDIRNKVAWQWNFFYGDSVANVDYGHYASGHGTHVAGTVGASTNNGYGVAGTAPGSQIIAAKVCGPWRVGNTEDDVNGVAIRCPDDVVMSALNYFAPVPAHGG